jgi:hypothetical protein
MGFDDFIRQVGQGIVGAAQGAYNFVNDNIAKPVLGVIK